jgi:deoxyadenosine/deoxycytidine kinase
MSGVPAAAYEQLYGSPTLPPYVPKKSQQRSSIDTDTDYSSGSGSGAAEAEADADADAAVKLLRDVDLNHVMIDDADEDDDVLDRIDADERDWVARAHALLAGRSVAVRGPIGVGKSTRVRELTATLRQLGVAAREFQEQVVPVLLQRYLGDPRRHAHSFQMHMTTAAVFRGRAAMMSSRNEALCALVERDHAENYHVFAVQQLLDGNMDGDQVWEVLQAASGGAGANVDYHSCDLALALFASASTCSARSQHRGRAGEERYLGGVGTLADYVRRMHDTAYFRWPLIEFEYDAPRGGPTLVPVLCEQFPTPQALIRSLSAAAEGALTAGTVSYTFYTEAAMNGSSGSSDGGATSTIPSDIDRAACQRATRELMRMGAAGADASVFERRWSADGAGQREAQYMARLEEVVLLWDEYELALESTAPEAAAGADAFVCAVYAELVRGVHVHFLVEQRYACAACKHRPRMCGVPFASTRSDAHRRLTVLARAMCQRCFERSAVKPAI